MQTTSREILRALRGHRSQVAFSRRLGYRSNVAADWEQGRRSPRILAVLEAAKRIGRDTDQLFATFHPPAAVPTPSDRATLSRWLMALNGDRPVREVAEQLGRDRQAVWRVLTGRTEPRLPDFLTLLDALTGRVTEWIAGLVDLEDIPSLAARHRQLLASRSIGLDQPWTMAVFMLLQARPGPHDATALATDLQVPVDTVSESLRALQDAGLIHPAGDRFTTTGTLSLDTRGCPEQRARLRAHWTNAALDRIAAPRPDDLFSYNVFAVSQDDLQRIRELQRAFYRSVRAIVAASPTTEAVALLNVQCIGLGPTPAHAPGEDMG